MMENIKILILLLIFSCNPQESNGHKKENPILKIEYNFYASSGGEPIYRVLYFDRRNNDLFPDKSGNLQKPINRTL